MKRGSTTRPSGRFEKFKTEKGDCSQLVELNNQTEALEEVIQESSTKTEVFDDHSVSILTQNESPDVGFESSVNPYRGCEHGCIYCYARPTHEYLGFSAGVDFETKIFVKREAPELLRKALLARSWKPKVINLSGVTDCYQPLEKKFKLTKGCLEVLTQFRNPFTIITKNHLVTRDIELLQKAAGWQGVRVFLSITTLDSSLVDKMEPRTSRPEFRLRAIEKLAKAGIPVGVMLAPIIPGLTDSEIPTILKAASEAGADSAGFVPLRLPYGVAALFEDWLVKNFPERKDKVLNRIREIRGGKLNDANFTTRMRGEGAYAEHLRNMFSLYRKRYGLDLKNHILSTEHFRRVEESNQLDLF